MTPDPHLDPDRRLAELGITPEVAADRDAFLAELLDDDVTLAAGVAEWRCRLAELRYNVRRWLPELYAEAHELVDVEGRRIHADEIPLYEVELRLAWRGLTLARRTILANL